MLKRHKRETEVIIALEKFETLNDGKLFSKLCQISLPFSTFSAIGQKGEVSQAQVSYFCIDHMHTCSRSFTRLIGERKHSRPSALQGP